MPAAMPMLPQVDPLPRPECESALDEGDRQRRRRDRRADVGGHVVRTFERVRVVRVAFRDVSIDPLLQVVPGARVRVLLDRQAGRRMLDHDRAQAVVEVRLGDDPLYVTRELVEAAARCVEFEVANHDGLRWTIERGDGRREVSVPVDPQATNTTM